MLLNEPCFLGSFLLKHQIVAAIVRLGTLEAKKTHSLWVLVVLLEALCLGSTFLHHRNLHPSKDPRGWDKLAIEVAMET